MASAEAGVGKTSIALGLAQLIAEGKVPLNLQETGDGGGRGDVSGFKRGIVLKGFFKGFCRGLLKIFFLSLIMWFLRESFERILVFSSRFLRVFQRFLCGGAGLLEACTLGGGSSWLLSGWLE